MGQKVNPLIMRLGDKRLGSKFDYRAIWNADPRDYSKKVKIDLLTRAYLEKALKTAGVSAIFIAFTTKKFDASLGGLKQGLANITVYVARPGIVIGKKGGAVE